MAHLKRFLSVTMKKERINNKEKMLQHKNRKEECEEEFFKR
jgi:hypothetical protein